MFDRLDVGPPAALDGWRASRDERGGERQAFRNPSIARRRRLGLPALIGGLTRPYVRYMLMQRRHTARMSGQKGAHHEQTDRRKSGKAADR